MTYDEILQYINSLSGNQVTSDQFEVNPNDPQMQQPNYFKRNSIAWGNVPGMEQYYSYDSANNQENFDLANGLPALEQQGYKWMDAYDPSKNAMANWIVGPDGQPIPESMRSQGGSDERFKLAALAAMGVTGANVLGAMGAGGATQAGMDPSAWDAAMQAGADASYTGAPIDAVTGLPSYAVDPYGGAVSGLPDYAIDPYGIDYSMNPSAAMPNVSPSGPAKPTAPPGVPKLPVKGGGLLDLLIPAAGAIGGAQPSAGETVTRESKTDPRIDKFLYDQYLPQLSEWYQANKTPNANQRAGWDKQLGLLNDPALSQQLGSMRSNAFGMMGAPVAGNPFSNGQATLNQQPWQPMPRRGLLGG